LILLKTFKAPNDLLFADVPLRNYSLTYRQYPLLKLAENMSYQFDRNHNRGSKTQHMQVDVNVIFKIYVHRLMPS